MDLYMYNIIVSVCLVTFLDFSTDVSRGYVTLHPAPAQVCEGRQLELTCTTNETALVWNFVPPLIDNQGASLQREWFIASEDLTQQLQQFILNSTSFAFVRASMRYDSPLMSTLTIINSSNALHMINVSCTEVIGVELAMTALTTIIVVGDTHTGNISPPAVSIIPMFEVGSVSVTLEWIPEDGVSYSVSSDQVVNFRYIQRTAVALTVLYNTPTNVTITATSCGHNSEIAITPIQLAYGRCEDPVLSISDDSVMAMGYDRSLALNGTLVTFSCPPGLMLNGPESVMCTHTGQWEPALSEVNCSKDTDTSSSAIPNLPGTNVVPSTSPELDDSNQILGISLGLALFGVVVIILVIVVVVLLMVMRTRRKGTVHAKEEPRYMRTEHINHPSHNNNNQDERNKDTLVYADIGPSQRRQQIPLLPVPCDFCLDDNTVEYAKLNHTLISAATTVESKVDDTTAVFDVNLDLLLIQLRPQVTSKWYEFGEAVGIKKEILDNCASKCAPDECIVEVLDYWLRYHVGQVTWREVAEALKLIGHKKLGLKIEEVYKTGKLPIEVNMNAVPDDSVFNTTDSDSDSPPPIPPKIMDFSDTGIPESDSSKHSIKTAVPPVPPKSVHARPSKFNDLGDAATEIPAIPPRPPKPY